MVPCYLVVGGGNKWRSGSINYGFWIVTLALFLLVGFLFPKLRFRTEEALEKVPFWRRVDYREKNVLRLKIYGIDCRY